MVQEDKPEKPRRKYKVRPRPEGEQEPEPVPHLTETEKKKLDAVSDDSLFLTMDERACVHISMEESREKAAIRLGWTIEQVLDCLKQPHVKMYAIEYQQQFMKSLASNRIKALTKVGINRTAIQERLMQLANLQPSETKGSIEGQVKALTQLANILGLTSKDDDLKDKTDEELQAIVNRANNAAKSTVQ